jgi:hypothetical protein
MSRASAAVELPAWPLAGSRRVISPRARRVLTRLLGALIAIEGVLALAAVSLPIST